MFLTDEQYNEIIAMLDGSIEQSPLLKELEAWFNKEFEILIFGYLCERTINNLTRLKIVIWSDKFQHIFREKDSVNYDKKIQEKIAIKFSQLAVKYNLHPEYHNYKDIFVCTDTLSDQIASKTMWSVKDRVMSLATGDIWKIYLSGGHVHIFYETDEQIEQHKNDGLNDRIKHQIWDIVKSVDKYNVFYKGVGCTFTSQQTLEEKYSGSMYFYLL